MKAEKIRIIRLILYTWPSTSVPSFPALTPPPSFVSPRNPRNLIPAPTLNLNPFSPYPCQQSQPTLLYPPPFLHYSYCADPMSKRIKRIAHTLKFFTPNLPFPCIKTTPPPLKLVLCPLPPSKSAPQASLVTPLNS